jgi:hypothetical protein
MPIRPRAFISLRPSGDFAIILILKIAQVQSRKILANKVSRVKVTASVRAYVAAL